MGLLAGESADMMSSICRRAVFIGLIAGAFAGLPPLAAAQTKPLAVVATTNTAQAAAQMLFTLLCLMVRAPGGRR
jgi:hypothetical protein